MFTLLMNCVKYLFILWLRVLQYSDLWSGIIIAISRVICSNLTKSQQWEETDLAVSGGVGLSPEEERDVGGQVGRPTEGVRTEPEAKHPSLAGLGHSASLYSWEGKYFEQLEMKIFQSFEWKKYFSISLLPSLFIPILKHFFSLQCWHWFLIRKLHLDWQTDVRETLPVMLVNGTVLVTSALIS